MYGGVGGQWLYVERGTPWAVDFSIDAVKQRDFDGRFDFRDYQTVTALAAVHYLRPMGRAALGLSVGLKGNGMCFAEPVLQRFPWLWFTLNNGLTSLMELGGSAIAGASPAHPVFAAFTHIFNLLLFGPTVVWGLRPPWSAQFLALPLVPIVLAIHSAVLVFVVTRGLRLRDSARAGRWLLFGSCAVLTGGFIFTPFGADPSGRYFVPLAAPLALFTAEMLHTLPGWFFLPARFTGYPKRWRSMGDYPSPWRSVWARYS